MDAPLRRIGMQPRRPHPIVQEKICPHHAQIPARHFALPQYQ